MAELMTYAFYMLIGVLIFGAFVIYQTFYPKGKNSDDEEAYFESPTENKPILLFAGDKGVSFKGRIINGKYSDNGNFTYLLVDTEEFGFRRFEGKPFEGLFREHGTGVELTIPNKLFNGDNIYETLIDANGKISRDWAVPLKQMNEEIVKKRIEAEVRDEFEENIKTMRNWFGFDRGASSVIKEFNEKVDNENLQKKDDS